MPDPTDPTVSEFLLPDLAEGLEEATILEWAVGIGDQVELNQVICTVETAKAEVEVPSPFAGTVQRLGGEEGQTLAVGDVLIAIDTDGGTAPAAADPAAAEPDREEPSRPGPTLVGYGPDDTIDLTRRERSSQVRAKPPVRKLAKELGVDLAAVTGTGGDGVVTREDVERATAASKGETTEVPVRGVRAVIAERMTTAHAEIPTASCSVVADCSALLDARKTLNAQAADAGLAKVVTPFSLLAALVVSALRSNPTLNASYDTDGPTIRLHRAVHLGVATSTERGLVVTVARDAGDLDVHDLSAEIARLGRAARDATLHPSETQGSTFTISNFGSLGLDEGIPIVNPPEAAILGVGSIKPRPHVIDGEVVARPTANLTLVFDHRVCDGAEAAAFLTAVRTLVESPELAATRR